jgi:hypothetical protein
VGGVGCAKATEASEENITVSAINRKNNNNLI